MSCSEKCIRSLFHAYYNQSYGIEEVVSYHTILLWYGSVITTTRKLD